MNKWWNFMVLMVWFCSFSLFIAATSLAAPRTKPRDEVMLLDNGVRDKVYEDEKKEFLWFSFIWVCYFFVLYWLLLTIINNYNFQLFSKGETGKNCGMTAWFERLLTTTEQFHIFLK